MKHHNAQLLAVAVAAFFAGAIVAGLLSAAAQPWRAFGPGMMGSGAAMGSGYGTGMMGPWMMRGMQAYRQQAAADCATMTLEQLRELGDQLMGQMVGDEQLHEQMDLAHPNIDAMHVLMGRMATGC